MIIHNVSLLDYQHRPHIPVLLREVVEQIQPNSSMVIIDGTFGAGGYSHALTHISGCQIIAFDKDPSAYIDRDFFGAQADHVTLIHKSFSSMQDTLAKRGIFKIDGIVLDLGLSSMQIDQPQRGFSFLHDGPLDMRMDTDSFFSAQDIINEYSEAEIADILWLYGEERKSRKIAKAIIHTRRQKPLTTTLALKNTIHDCFSEKEKSRSRIDVATRSFQALRIAVNYELDELKIALQDACALLNPSGRLVVVSFHSLEDRIVKHFMRQKAAMKSNPNRYQPMIEQAPSDFDIPFKKAIIPKDDELALNPRSRSAKLRVLQRKG